jgi:hypothetical protein
LADTRSCKRWDDNSRSGVPVASNIAHCRYWNLAVYRQQRQANRLPFLQKQLELCFQATETAGRLSSETDPVEWEKDRVVFWRLYWGPLSIVENPAFESAMVALGKLIPNKPDPSIKLPMTSLGPPSYMLAHAARDLVLSSWRVDLPDLRGQRTE